MSGTPTWPPWLLLISGEWVQTLYIVLINKKIQSYLFISLTQNMNKHTFFRPQTLYGYKNLYYTSTIQKWTVLLYVVQNVYWTVFSQLCCMEVYRIRFRVIFRIVISAWFHGCKHKCILQKLNQDHNISPPLLHARLSRHSLSIAWTKMAGTDHSLYQTIPSTFVSSPIKGTSLNWTNQFFISTSTASNFLKCHMGEYCSK